MSISINELIKEGIEISQGEKIDTGVHPFTLTNIEMGKTPRSEKPAIKYVGTIVNSKRMPQKATVTDNIDTEAGIKFAVARLSKMLTLHGVGVEELALVGTLEDLIEFKSRIIGKVFQLEFSKKQLQGKDGKYITVNEKSFKL